jgi:hypothetical protein
MAVRIFWNREASSYIRSRSARYPAAVDVDPAWTQEVLEDPDLVVFDPDPKSRIGATRYIGDSPSAEAVLVVIVYRDLNGDVHGVNAWPATGVDLDVYQQGGRNG